MIITSLLNTWVLLSFIYSVIIHYFLLLNTISYWKKSKLKSWVTTNKSLEGLAFDIPQIQILINSVTYASYASRVSCVFSEALCPRYINWDIYVLENRTCKNGEVTVCEKVVVIRLPDHWEMGNDGWEKQEKCLNHSTCFPGESSSRQVSRLLDDTGKIASQDHTTGCPGLVMERQKWMKQFSYVLSSVMLPFRLHCLFGLSWFDILHKDLDPFTDPHLA